MTRLVLFVVVASAGAASAGTRAEAQNYPWCAQYSGTMGGSMNCGFVSFDQCMMTVRGMGGFCVVNTLYQPTGPAVRRSYSRKKS
jgi:hypothetical protein